MPEIPHSMTDIGAFLLEEKDELNFSADGDPIWELSETESDDEGEVTLDYQAIRTRLSSIFTEQKK